MLAENSTRPIKQYIDDDSWWMQQKFDGHRVIVAVEDGRVTPLNRNGDIKTSGIKPQVLDPFRSIRSGVWYFDGEIIDSSTLVVFDLVAPAALDASYPYSVRHDVLTRFLDDWDGGADLIVARTAKTPSQKQALFEMAQHTAKEGVILRHVDGTYETGRRSTKLAKFKFVHTADCVVMEVGVDGKENAVLGVFDYHDRQLIEVGKCSLIGKPPVEVGDVVEVKYLYATKDDRLYQPRLMKVRHDKRPTPLECSVRQLIYTDKTSIL